MSSLPRAGAAEAHARAHATGVGIEPTPEGCAYRAQAGLNVPRWYQRRMDAGTCVYRGIKPHKVGAMIHGFACVLLVNKPRLSRVLLPIESVCTFDEGCLCLRLRRPSTAGSART